MRKIYDFFGSRKLFFAILLTVIMTVFVMIDKAIVQNWIDFEKWVFGLYAAGNIGEHMSNKMKSK